MEGSETWMSLRGGSLSGTREVRPCGGGQSSVGAEGKKKRISQKPRKAEARGHKQQKAHWTLIRAVARPMATQAQPAAHTDSEAFLTLSRLAKGSSQ